MSVVVVGGGISGLLCAWELTQRGHSVTVIEADRVGGSVRGALLGDFLADVGAEAYSVVRPEAQRLIDRLGLESVAPRRSDARLVRAGVTAPIPAASVLGIPSDPAASDVAAFLDSRAIERALADSTMPMSDSLPASLGGLVRARMGDAVVDRLVDPVVRGVHAIRADEIDADTVAPGLRAAMVRAGSLAGGVRALLEGRVHATGVAGSAVRSVPGGMTRAVDALARVCGAHIVESAPVVSVRHEGGLRVETAGVSYNPDHVVLAVPCSRAATLLGGGELTAHLRRVALGDVVVVALRVHSRQLSQDPVGSGALVDRSDIRAKGLTHASAKWEWIAEALPTDEHIVRMSYGRDAEDPWTVLGRDPLATARADLTAITGVDDAIVLDGHVQPWPQSLSHPSPLHANWRATLTEQLSRLPGLHLVGPGISGNGIAGAVATVAELMESFPAPSR